MKEVGKFFGAAVVYVGAVVGLVIAFLTAFLLALIPGLLLHLFIAWVIQWLLLALFAVSVPLFPLFVGTWLISIVLKIFL